MCHCQCCVYASLLHFAHCAILASPSSVFEIMKEPKGFPVLCAVYALCLCVMGCLCAVFVLFACVSFVSCCVDASCCVYVLRGSLLTRCARSCVLQSAQGHGDAGDSDNFSWPVRGRRRRMSRRPHRSQRPIQGGKPSLMQL